jgi:hypothetical protein
MGYEINEKLHKKQRNETLLLFFFALVVGSICFYFIEKCREEGSGIESYAEHCEMYKKESPEMYRHYQYCDSYEESSNSYKIYLQNKGN